MEAISSSLLLLLFLRRRSSLSSPPFAVVVQWRNRQMWLFCLQGRKKGEKKFLPSSTFSCTTTTTCDDAWGGIRHLAKKPTKDAI